MKMKKQLKKQQEKQLENSHNPYTSVYEKRNQWTENDF
jgi:hypothetical protein